MSERFIELFQKIDKTDCDYERELWIHLNKCVNKKYRFVNPDCIEYVIEVIYFRGFDRIGVNFVSDAYGEVVMDEWDVELFYEIIKDSTEIK